MTADREVLNRLRAPFPVEAIGKLPKVTCATCSDRKRECDKHTRRKCRTCAAYVSTAHIHVDFVGHAHATERLLDVDPEWNWEPLSLNDNGLPAVDGTGGLWIRLTVGGMTRLGYGHANGKTGGDAVKEVIGDAIRNAAMRFGVALDLWKKEPGGVVMDDEPSRQVDNGPTLTPDERRARLRGEIATFGRNNNRTVEEIAADFVTWSRGTEINRADAATLEEYLDHLRKQATEDTA